MQVIKDERGSLSILTTTLFFILVLSSFVILNLSSAFLAKRELVQIGEVAITRASQNLDMERYYLQDSDLTTVPVDCGAAYDAFVNEISANSVRGRSISLDSWSCEGDSPTATISVKIRPLLAIPFMSTNKGSGSATESASNSDYGNNSADSDVTVTATLGATSTVQSLP
jgi:uncharacterized membrane protein